MTQLCPTAVLVIDTDLHVRKLLTTVLSAAGYDVVCAPTAVEAIDLGPVHLVLTDDPAARAALAPACKILRLEKPFRPSALLRSVEQALS